MAWEFYSWERSPNLPDLDQSWGLKVDKFDGDYMNVKIQMTEDDVSFEEKSCRSSVEALPADPFDMKSSWTTVSVWFEGSKGLESDLDEYKTEEGDQLCAELHGVKEDEHLGNFCDSDSYFVDDGINVDFLPQNVEELLSYALASICCVSNQADKGLETVYPDKEDDDMPDSLSYVDILPENVEVLLNHALESLCVFGYQADNSTQIALPTYANGEGEGEGEGSAHEAWTYVLNYLGVKDLLSVQGVCKSLNDELKRDSHIWRNICIDAELSSKISDDTLLRLTNKAEGTLQSLSFIGCSRITDSGLARVIQSNPRLTTLCVPGCLRLTMDGIVSSVKEFMRTAKPGLKHLRIAGLYGMTNKHIKELKAILGSDKHTTPKSPKPMFYHMAQWSLACLDDRVLDIDTCPQCQEARLVYDCPAESCRSKTHSVEQCRGCINCIPRCIMCGGCITDCHFTETFCLEYLCWDCVQKPKSRNRKDGNGDVDLKCMIIIQGVHCQCCMLS